MSGTIFIDEKNLLCDLACAAVKNTGVFGSMIKDCLPLLLQRLRVGSHPVHVIQQNESRNVFLGVIIEELFKTTVSKSFRLKRIIMLTSSIV